MVEGQVMSPHKHTLIKTGAQILDFMMRELYGRSLLSLRRALSMVEEGEKIKEVEEVVFPIEVVELKIMVVVLFSMVEEGAKIKVAMAKEEQKIRESGTVQEEKIMLGEGALALGAEELKITVGDEVRTLSMVAAGELIKEDLPMA